jgi:hypothetical protein
LTFGQFAGRAGELHRAAEPDRRATRCSTTSFKSASTSGINRAGIYARYNFSDDQADSPGFVFENISEFQAGGDVAWQGFRAAANFTDRQSSLYDYQSVTLSEGYSLRASPALDRRH